MSREFNYYCLPYLFGFIWRLCSSNVNEVIRAISNIFIYEKISQAQKAQKAQRRNQAKAEKVQKAQKAQKRKRAKNRLSSS